MRCLGGDVEDELLPFDRFAHQLDVSKVARDQSNPIAYRLDVEVVAAVPMVEAVEDRDLGALRGQVDREIGAEKAQAAGYEDFSVPVVRVEIHRCWFLAGVGSRRRY